MPRLHFDIVPIILVSIGSAYLAGNGIHEITRDLPLFKAMGVNFAGLVQVYPLPPETWQLLLCLALAAFLQLLIAVFWTQAFRSRGLGLAPLAIGGTGSVVSALVSSAFLVLAAQGVVLRQQARITATDPLRQQLTAFADQMTQVAGAAQALAADAERLRHIEQTAGGTCPGDLRRGSGPLMRLRESHATLLASVAPEVGAAAAAALRLTIEVQQVPADEIASVFTQAVILSRGPALDQARAVTARIRSELSEGWVERGAFHTCPTPDFLGRVEAMEATIAAILPLDTAVPRERAPSVSDSLELVFGTLGRLWGGQPVDKAPLVAVGIAVMIEIFQIAAIRLRERRLAVQGNLPDRNDQFWRAKTRLSASERAFRKRLAAQLNASTWWDGARAFYVAPSPVSHPDQLMVVHFFNLKVIDPALRNFDLRSVDPDWVRGRPHLAEAPSFTLYSVKGTDDWLRRTARDTDGTPPRDEP